MKEKLSIPRRLIFHAANLSPKRRQKLIFAYYTEDVDRLKENSGKT